MEQLAKYEKTQLLERQKKEMLLMNETLRKSKISFEQKIKEQENEIKKENRWNFWGIFK